MCRQACGSQLCFGALLVCHSMLLLTTYRSDHASIQRAVSLLCSVDPREERVCILFCHVVSGGAWTLSRRMPADREYYHQMAPRPDTCAG